MSVEDDDSLQKNSKLSENLPHQVFYRKKSFERQDKYIILSINHIKRSLIFGMLYYLMQICEVMLVL